MGSRVDGGIEGHIRGCADCCGRLSVMFILDNHRYPVILLVNGLLLHGSFRCKTAFLGPSAILGYDDIATARTVEILGISQVSDPN